MEIISIVLFGTLTHHEPGVAVSIPHRAAQMMSAHQGMVHAEGNATDSPVRMLQLWVSPREGTLQQIPGTYDVLGPFGKMGEWMQVTPKTLRQAVRVFVAHIDSNTTLDLVIPEGKSGYLLCAQEDPKDNGLTVASLGGNMTLLDGDGANMTSGRSRIEATGAATVVLIEQ
jgi:quercetin 2,3-dioxygenase